MESRDGPEVTEVAENAEAVPKRDFEPEKPKITPQLPLQLRDKPDIRVLMQGVYTPKQLLELTLYKEPTSPWWEKGWIYCICGTTKRGKSHFEKWLMYETFQAAKAPGAYWHIDYIKGMSSSAKMGHDLDFLPPEQIVKFYDHQWLQALIERQEQIQEHLTAIGSTKTPPHTVVIMDDMIGAINAEDAMNMRKKKETSLWEKLATGGRRYNVSIFQLLQKFQFNINTVRDGLTYVALTNIPPSGIDYIWAKMQPFGLWDEPYPGEQPETTEDGPKGKKKFRYKSPEKRFFDWCSAVLVDYQIIIFYMLAKDWRDSFRIVKAPKEPPPKFQIKLVRTKQTKAINDYTEAQRQAAEAANAPAEEEGCWIS